MTSLDYINELLLHTSLVIINTFLNVPIVLNMEIVVLMIDTGSKNQTEQIFNLKSYNYIDSMKAL